jgi:hypothetical protein
MRQTIREIQNKIKKISSTLDSDSNEADEGNSE